MIRTEIFLAVEKYVRTLLKEKLPRDLCFHNLSHTIMVVNACEEISRGLHLSSEDLETLLIAAWFHDTGYIRTYLGHEEESRNIAAEFLFKKGYPASKINKISKCIMATKMDHTPKHITEKVIHDADFYHLSTADYFNLQRSLRREWETVPGIKMSDSSWHLRNLDFLTDHKYYTAYARTALEKGKRQNVKKILSVVEGGDMKEDYQLTIIVPVFNETECLHQFKLEMDRYLEQTPVKSMILFIDDGSTDGSLTIIKSICHAADDYYYASLDSNNGLSTAIKTGIDLCNTRFVGYIDADLQTSPLDFLKFFDYLGCCDMINGIRRRRIDTITKRLSSKIANTFRRVMIHDGIVDTCCPLKIMESSMAKKLPFFRGMHRFMPALVQLLGGTVEQVDVSHFARYSGVAKYHLFNRLVGPFFDTLAFMWMRKKNIHYNISEQELIHELHG